MYLYIISRLRVLHSCELSLCGCELSREFRFTRNGLIPRHLRVDLIQSTRDCVHAEKKLLFSTYFAQQIIFSVLMIELLRKTNITLVFNAFNRIS